MKPIFYSRGSQGGIGKILLFSFFVTLFGVGHAQKKDSIPMNAYYLSKDLYTASKNIKQNHAKKDSIAKNTLAKLYYYAGTDEPSELQKMVEGSPVLDSLLNLLQKTALFCTNLDKVEVILSASGKSLGTVEILDLLKKDTINKHNLDTIKRIEENINRIYPGEKTGVFKLKKADYPGITLIKWENVSYLKKLKSENDTMFQFNYSLLLSMKDSFLAEKKQIHAEAVHVFDDLSIQDKYSLKVKGGLILIEPFAPEFRRQFDQIQQQDALITVSIIESSSGSISGWKMPSEAEMIDAVATYIASRVKQETVLWFFDQMRNNTERYELIMTAFPETMNLIQSSEVFDAPNMGAAWKYALSKDFIHLLKNVLSSEWIKERIPKEQQKYLDLTCISWEIAELVSNRLSYRDMIKQLYLKRNLDDPKQIDNFPDSIITFLYAVSNELYIVNKGSVRNLTYEELSSMPFGQMEIMLELLNMKYSKSIDNLFLDKLHINITKDDKREIAKWIGNTMLALSQFDKIMQQVEESKKGNNGETALFDGYNTWKLISQVVRSSLPTRKESIYKKYLDRADDAFEIYHLLSEKNYAGAVSKTLELVDSLIYNEYLEINPHLVKKDAPFLLSVSQVKETKVRYYAISTKQLTGSLSGPQKERLDSILNNQGSFVYIPYFIKTKTDKEKSLILSYKGLKKSLKSKLNTSINNETRKRVLSLFKKYKVREKIEHPRIKKKAVKIKSEDWEPRDSTRYRITISDLDDEFVKRHVKPKKFPRIARDLKKSAIYVYTDDAIPFDNKTTKQQLITIESHKIKSALTINECPIRQHRLEHLFKKFNRTEIDQIIENLHDWGGEKIRDSLIRFPINSIAVQALISSDKKAMQMIMKLASFLNDVAKSDNEKELKKVIESYALPPGSYKQKRNSWHSLTLNAFAGPYCGFETAGFLSAKRRNDTLSSCAWNYGISAPIGITYTKTFGKRIYNTSRLPDLARENPDFIKIKRKNLYKRTNASLSISLTFIDIGAVVSYRMSHTENVLDQSFKWEQFISPGFNIGMAIPKTPLTVQLGYQYTPKVRRIITEQIDTGEEVLRKDEHFGMWRAYLGVYFDIPLVNLWMKTRSVKYE